MSRTILARELVLIRRRLEAIEEALAEEMSAEDKAALQEALHEYSAGKSVAFRPARAGNRKH